VFAGSDDVKNLPAHHFTVPNIVEKHLFSEKKFLMQFGHDIRLQFSIDSTDH